MKMGVRKYKRMYFSCGVGNYAWKWVQMTKRCVFALNFDFLLSYFTKDSKLLLSKSFLKTTDFVTIVY